MTEPDPPEAPAGETAPTSAAPTADERTWALLAHILAIPTNFIAPLVIWLIKKDDSEFVDDQAREALNFQITVLIASVVCALTVFCGIGVVLLPVVGLLDLVLCILAAIKSHEGQRYRYPWALRLL